MWESKEQAIDLSYNAEELWLKGVYGQPVNNKPLEIRKWEENAKFFKLLDKTYPRSKADRILQDLSLIALTYSKQAVQQRLIFKPNSKGKKSLTRKEKAEWVKRQVVAISGYDRPAAPSWKTLNYPPQSFSRRPSTWNLP
jgi:hypothetical protein